MHLTLLSSTMNHDAITNYRAPSLAVVASSSQLTSSQSNKSSSIASESTLTNSQERVEETNGQERVEESVSVLSTVSTRTRVNSRNTKKRKKHF